MFFRLRIKRLVIMKPLHAMHVNKYCQENCSIKLLNITSKLDETKVPIEIVKEQIFKKVAFEKCCIEKVMIQIKEKAEKAPSNNLKI